MKGFSIIVATDEERGIGKANRIPWNISGDMKHFKDITTATYADGCKNVVIMGRKTWESLPASFRPLPGRLNVVVSANLSYELPVGVMRCGSLQGAIDLYCGEREGSFGEVFVIGGAAVYAEAIKHICCKKIFRTVINGKFGCDTFFPEIPDYFRECTRSEIYKDKKLTYYFVELISDRISK
ncbi:MAG: dihydrofolate reductase [Candidatus Omnitrophica bacterium]|nr:dihydrofolate reductase [Candidatus Omnitrophota bacterium]